MIFLNKILPLLVSPMVIIFLVALLTVFFRSTSIRVFLVLIIYLFSCPIIGSNSLKFLEKEFVPGDLTSLQKTSGVLVLGGMLRTIKSSNGIAYEFNEAVDRFEAGIKLLKNDKANFIIFTRGQLPWSVGKPEGEILAKLATERGISSKQILLTEIVNNTSEESKAVKKLIGKNEELILVTSAFHMNRASTIFKRDKIKFVPFAVDFRHSQKEISIIDFFPTGEALKNNSLLIRELIGRAYYAIQ